MTTDNQAILFRYFADPHHFSTYQSRPRKCDICGQVRPGYADAFFTEANAPDIKFVCEPDLHDGLLAKVGAQVNNGDRFELMEQVGKVFPKWTEAEFDQYIQERSHELEISTPSVPTWQDYAWPAHCADYMRYIKEIGQADCNRLAGNGNGRAFFETAIEPSYKEGEDDAAAFLDELWDRMRPDAPADNTAISETSFYLFQCLECGVYLIEWDADEVTANESATAYLDPTGS